MTSNRSSSGILSVRNCTNILSSGCSTETALTYLQDLLGIRMFIRNCTNISTEEHSSSVCSWRTVSTNNKKSTGKIVIIRMFTKNFKNKSASKLSLGGFLWAGPTCKQRNCQTGNVSLGDSVWAAPIKLSLGGSFSTAPRLTDVQANCTLSSSGCSLLTSLTKLKNNHLFLENYREVYYELRHDIFGQTVIKEMFIMTCTNKLKTHSPSSSWSPRTAPANLEAKMSPSRYLLSTAPIYTFKHCQHPYVLINFTKRATGLDCRGLHHTFNLVVYTPSLRESNAECLSDTCTMHFAVFRMNVG